VKVVARDAIDAERFFDHTFFDFEADESANAGMKNTARCARVYHCLEPFRAGAFLEGSAMLTFNIVE